MVGKVASLLFLLAAPSLALEPNLWIVCGMRFCSPSNCESCNAANDDCLALCADGTACNGYGQCLDDVTTQPLPPPPVPVPVPVCNNGLCGQVVAAEDVSPLSGVFVEVRDTAGRVVCRTVTVNGAYQFDAANCSLALGSQYFITPIIGRGQFALPFVQAVTAPSSVPLVKVARIPATVTLQGCEVGTFVLLTRGPYSAAVPPSVFRGSSQIEAYTTVADTTGNAVLKVHGQGPANVPYNVTAWTQNLSGNSRATGVLSGVVGPGKSINDGCPIH